MTAKPSGILNKEKLFCNRTKEFFWKLKNDFTRRRDGFG